MPVNPSKSYLQTMPSFSSVAPQSPPSPRSYWQHQRQQQQQQQPQQQQSSAETKRKKLDPDVLFEDIRSCTVFRWNVAQISADLERRIVELKVDFVTARGRMDNIYRDFVNGKALKNENFIYSFFDKYPYLVTDLVFNNNVLFMSKFLDEIFNECREIDQRYNRFLKWFYAREVALKRNAFHWAARLGNCFPFVLQFAIKIAKIENDGCEIVENMFYGDAFDNGALLYILHESETTQIFKDILLNCYESNDKCELKYSLICRMVTRTVRDQKSLGNNLPSTNRRTRLFSSTERGGGGGVVERLLSPARR